MKRDLKINYGILDDIINQLGIYKRSLTNMESSLSTITTYIEQNHGESIEAWKDRMKGSREQMEEYEAQINDLLNLFQGYVDDTTTYITPLQRKAMMRVDRNDIYWNLKQMESGICTNIRKAIRITNQPPSFWGFWEDVTDTEKEASSINKSRISSIRSDIEQTNSRLNHKMDQLWDLYNSKVKKYENMDDEYNDKAAALKKKYTNYFEGLWDLAEGTGKFVADLVVGLLKGLFIDIGWGLIKLVYNVGVVAVSIQISDKIEPKFLKDAADERIDSFYTMVQQIVEDPFSVVEGMGQSISDSVEEDGIVYVTGGVAAGFVPIVGWSKYAKLAKVGDVDSSKAGVNDTHHNNSNRKIVDNDTSKLTKELEELKTPKEKGKFLLEKSKTLDVSTEKNQAIFYAGRVQVYDRNIGKVKNIYARELAESYANRLLNEKGITKLTLERTPGGKWMDDLKLYDELPNGNNRYEVEYGLTREQADEIWSTLSSRFAENASGAITAFSKNVPDYVKFRTIFWSTELPELRKNPNVTHINIR